MTLKALSRVILVCPADDAAEAAAEAAGAPIMVLDELDSGVGGRLGGAVGALLRRMTLSAGSGNGKGAAAQVLCVSHLPQVRMKRIQNPTGFCNQYL